MNEHVRYDRSPIEATYTQDGNVGYVEGKVVEITLHYHLKRLPNYMRLHLEDGKGGKESFPVLIGYLYRDGGRRNGLLGSWVKLRHRLGNITWDIAKVEVSDASSDVPNQEG